DTMAYAALSRGFLPDAQVHARAKRWAVKLFLSHAFEVGHFLENGALPPDPYASAILSHADRIEPMHTDLIPGYMEAKRERRKENASRPQQIGHGELRE